MNICPGCGLKSRTIHPKCAERLALAPLPAPALDRAPAPLPTREGKKVGGSGYHYLPGDKVIGQMTQKARDEILYRLNNPDKAKR